MMDANLESGKTMLEKRSLKWPILLGVIMIVLLLALTVGWILLTAINALRERDSGFYWGLLVLGTTFLVLVLGGVVAYLALSVKAINLNQRQSNFVDSVTHELKSPIASLKLYLQTLNRRQVSPEEQGKFFRIMLADVARLDDLINHLLNAALIDRPAADEEKTEVALDALIARNAEEARVRHQAAEDAVELSLIPALVVAREVDLDLIFSNLLDNAFKYGGSPPHVRVSMTMRGLFAVIEVSDNGGGVPRAARRKVFRRFVRLGDELKRERRGTGLGLYIVQTLVKRLGGRVAIRDSGAGAGALFEIRLPAELASTPTTAEAAA